MLAENKVSGGKRFVMLFQAFKQEVFQGKTDLLIEEKNTGGGGLTATGSRDANRGQHAELCQHFFANMTHFVAKQQSHISNSQHLRAQL